ncbi:peptidoglycan DD-metalloendopeptidase family protein [Alteromonas halophila]|uniref:Lipoprotein NlpD n=1 Tax=Alteromonas halophila TaxID=516698 RepID=A0A918JGL5_9ALTE|nr:peptidoglycan DD-metalloendopeptidase family protein [Alteromonas halophila]GGW79885.1 lipoprotein NlpD [Alteromonas halophila]
MRYSLSDLTCCLVFVTILLSVNGCSSRSTPAPLVLLDSQPDEDTGYTKDTYQVQKGDTLFGIAWYTGNDYRDLARYNQLSPPYNIYPGQTLRVSAPRAVQNSSISQAKPSPKRSGTTTKTKQKNSVDPSSDQAYGESEKDVNNQSVKRSSRASAGTSNNNNKGFPARVTQWVWPAKGKLVGTFSQADSGNKGIDIRAARGSDVSAAADGKVVYAGDALRGYGNLIIIKHTDTFLSAYAHNDTINVKEQQWVSAGERIATMGNSGTDSVKLHFEVRYRGKSLDPLRYLPGSKP